MQSPNNKMGKRRLFNSPQSFSPKQRRNFSPEQTSTSSELTGYLVTVGEVVVASTGNNYFDVKLKTNEFSFVNVRVMVLGVNRQDFTSLLHKPVQLNKVSKLDKIIFSMLRGMLK